jgi:signal transduction histidine kinase/PAS domain-containing protein
MACLLQSENLKETRVADVLNEPLITLALRDYRDLEATLEQMQQQQLHQLPVVDEGGALVGVLRQARLRHYLRDHQSHMTAQPLPSLTERQLRQSEQRFQHLVANLPGAVFRYIQRSDGSNAVLYMSPGCFKLWEVEADVVMKSSQILWEMVHPDDLEAMIASVQQSAQTLQPWTWSWRIITPSGQLKWLQAAGQPQRQANGDVIWDSLILDVTHTKTIEMALQKAEQELHLLNTRLQYQVEVRNAELEQMISYERLLHLITDEVRSSLEEQTILQTTVQEVAEGLHLTYCNVSLLEPVPLPDPLPDPLYYTIAYEHTRFPLSFQGANAPINSHAVPQLMQGETIYFSTDHPLWGLSVNVVCPIRDDRGLIGFLRLIRLPAEEFTLAEIRLAEQVASQCAIAIRQAKLFAAAQQKVHRLTELNRLKDEFLDTVSHELRTPLTNMKMALAMLEIHQDPDRQQRYMQMLKAEWQRELNLVNELLELQGLESGSRALAITAISLSTWLPSVTHSLLMRFQERQIRFACQLPSDLGLLHTDAALLERILLELLNNACKYTPAQEQVILSVTPMATGYQFQVINTGVVIPAEQLNAIFEKFHRITALDCYNQGGTGLGLALVKKAVEILRGQIQVHSGAGVTCFQVDLPRL